MPRSRPFCTLPVTVSGSASTTSIRRRLLEAGQADAAVLADGVRDGRGGVGAAAHDVGHDGLAGLRVGDADHGGLGDARRPRAITSSTSVG